MFGVSPSTAAVASSPKLLDRVRWHLRVKHYSIRTEQAYVDLIRRYILFHRKRHPSEMGEKEISEFLTHLAVEKHVAASTQNQAFAAILFLYQQCSSENSISSTTSSALPARPSYRLCSRQAKPAPSLRSSRATI